MHTKSKAPFFGPKKKLSSHLTKLWNAKCQNQQHIFKLPNHTRNMPQVRNNNINIIIMKSRHLDMFINITASRHLLFFYPMTQIMIYIKKFAVYITS